MDTLGAFVGVFGFLAIIIGLLMFVPIPALKKRRPLAAKIALGGLAGFLFALFATPTGKDGQAASAPPTSATAAAPEAKEAPIDTKKQLEGEARNLWEAVLAAAKPCDRAADDVSTSAKSGDVYRLYGAAKRGEEACQNASTAIGDMKPPASAEEDGEAAFSKAIDQCSTAQFARVRAFGKVAEVADGNMRPSAVTEAKEMLETAGAGGLYCAAGFFDAAGKSGVDTKIFGK
jgi:hypothetical protein